MTSDETPLGDQIGFCRACGGPTHTMKSLRCRICGAWSPAQSTDEVPCHECGRSVWVQVQGHHCLQCGTLLSDFNTANALKGLLEGTDPQHPITVVTIADEYAWLRGKAQLSNVVTQALVQGPNGVLDCFTLRFQDGSSRSYYFKLSSHS